MMKVCYAVRQLVLLSLCSLLIVTAAHAADKVKLKGSGASFPFPLYG